MSFCSSLNVHILGNECWISLRVWWIDLSSLLYIAVSEKWFIRRKTGVILFMIYGFWSLILNFYIISPEKGILWDRCNEILNIFIRINQFIFHTLAMAFIIERTIMMKHTLLSPSLISQIYIFAKLHNQMYIYIDICVWKIKPSLREDCNRVYSKTSMIETEDI